MTVARHARRLIDNGLADAHQSVEQSRFAHIRASYDSYQIHTRVFFRHSLPAVANLAAKLSII
jgi:hypothetical protein